MTHAKNHILVIDDQSTILEDFTRLLAPTCDPTHRELDELAALLGDTPAAPRGVVDRYELTTAAQGALGVAAHAAALARGQAPSVAFVDIHMPPGIDGIETVRQLWDAQPDLEVVLCTAHSDYSWAAILDRLPRRDQLVILRKPFDPIEVRQLAACLSEKWQRGRALAQRMKDLEIEVERQVSRRLEIELRHAQKFEELGRLAAGIAHEINTPTQYIQSNLEFLHEALAAPDPTMLADIHLAIDDALEGISRITRIVGSVREYAHNSQRDTPEVVDINRQVRMAAELARSQYKHDAELVLDLGSLPTITGYPDELGRAILNLLVNAAQATRAARAQGKPRGCITIRTRVVNDSVAIDVIDTGVGIPAEHRAHVFEPFFTTKPRGEGTGQGLPMARETVVHRHGGSLTFESEVGHGTRFHIELPIAEAHASVRAVA